MWRQKKSIKCFYGHYSRIWFANALVIGTLPQLPFFAYPVQLQYLLQVGRPVDSEHKWNSVYLSKTVSQLFQKVLWRESILEVGIEVTRGSSPAHTGVGHTHNIVQITSALTNQILEKCPWKHLIHFTSEKSIKLSRICWLAFLEFLKSFYKITREIYMWMHSRAGL